MKASAAGRTKKKELLNEFGKNEKEPNLVQPSTHVEQFVFILSAMGSQNVRMSECQNNVRMAS